MNVADLIGRVAPGESGAADYTPVFRLLKSRGYDKRISIEANGITQLVEQATASFALLRKTWDEA